MKKPYNLTQLEPFSAIGRGIVHRDLIAHVLRWSHVLKIAKIGMNILDVGCGSGNMYEVFYRNKYSPTLVLLKLRFEIIPGLLRRLKLMQFSFC